MYFQQHILFNFMVALPVHSVCHAINKKIDRGSIEGVELHHQGLILVDFGVCSQHFANLVCDRFHAVQIIVTQTDGLIDPAVAHARGVFHRGGREHRVWHVYRPFIELADGRLPPADIFHHAFDALFLQHDPVAH